MVPKGLSRLPKRRIVYRTRPKLAKRFVGSFGSRVSQQASEFGEGLNFGSSSSSSRRHSSRSRRARK